MQKYWIWAQLALECGSYLYEDIKNFFGTPEKLYNATDSVRKSSNIFSPKNLFRLKTTSLKDAEKIIKECEKRKINIITVDDEKFPNCLKNIQNPPFVIYTRGEFVDFDNEPTICIVGPRRISEFGKKSAFSLGYRLAKGGMTVVSGGALGGDTAVHKGALYAKGKTCAVLACGIDDTYLSENEELRKRIEKSGCLITEYPPFTKVNRQTFRVRNRIMSALSLGTVIIEAAKKSGTLITASHALDQGKDVFVIPGNPTYSQYKGSNLLLRDGAVPLIDATDVFNEYFNLFPDKIDIEKAYAKETASNNTENIKKTEKIMPEGLSKNAKIVYNQLDNKVFYADDIANGEIDSATVFEALGELELLGLIRAVPGGRYVVND